jgi:hypothetical protein
VGPILNERRWAAVAKVADAMSTKPIMLYDLGRLFGDAGQKVGMLHDDNRAAMLTEAIAVRQSKTKSD